MDDYKSRAKLNWGILVCDFWIKVANAAQAIGKYAVRKGADRVKTNLKLAGMLDREEYSEELAEINKILEEA